MAVPRNRHSNARKNKRRSHLAKKGAAFVKCGQCGKLVLPHRLCGVCGFYKGLNVMGSRSRSVVVSDAKPLVDGQ